MTENKMDLSKVGKTKTTFLSVIGLIMAVWAANCYKTGEIQMIDWPLVCIIGFMTFGRCVQIWADKKLTTTAIKEKINEFN